MSSFTHMSPRVPVFIVGRFRSGSTLLWNIFRHIEGTVAYYEPLHDNLPAHVRGNTPAQPSHRGVSSYWDEYLPFTDELDRFHRKAFGVTRLWLEAGDSYPELADYLNLLIEKSGQKQAVFKANRLDFRLPWIRHHFPDSKIIYLFRDPREEWLSMVNGLAAEERGNPDCNTGYELVTWSCALAPVFPFLVGPHIKHSYQRHYFIWTLSRKMGLAYADLVLDYRKDLLQQPEKSVRALFRTAGRASLPAEKLVCLIEEDKKKTHLPGEIDFERMENECENIIDLLGLNDWPDEKLLSQARRENLKLWQEFQDGALQEVARLSMLNFSVLRTDYLHVVSALREAEKIIKMEYAGRVRAEQRLTENQIAVPESVPNNRR